MLNRLAIILVLPLLVGSLSVCASSTTTNKKQSPSERKEILKLVKQHVQHPFYIGGSIGYGETDWSQITTAIGNPAAASAPITANSNGLAFGAIMGYQFSRHFLIEADYTHFADSKVGFETSADTPGGYNTYGLKSLKTGTSSYALLLKILVPFLNSKSYVYADTGAAYVYRSDKSVTADPNNPPVYYTKQHKGHFGASFGFGVARNVTEHIFTELSFQYTTGFGKADATPAEDYIPFVYSLMFNIGYRI